MAGRAQAMSRFAHWIVDAALKHNAALNAAKAIDPRSDGNAQRVAEAEVSRLSCALFEKLHTLEKLVREYGVEEFFGPRPEPLTEEQKLPVLR